MPARHGVPGIWIQLHSQPHLSRRLPSSVFRLPSPSVYGFTARNTIACAPNDSATFRVSALELPAK